MARCVSIRDYPSFPRRRESSTPSTNGAPVAALPRDFRRGGRAALQLAQYAYWIPAFAGMTSGTDILGHGSQFGQRPFAFVCHHASDFQLEAVFLDNAHFAFTIVGVEGEGPRNQRPRTIYTSVLGTSATITKCTTTNAASAAMAKK